MKTDKPPHTHCHITKTRRIGAPVQFDLDSRASDPTYAMRAAAALRSASTSVERQNRHPMVGMSLAGPRA